MYSVHPYLQVQINFLSRHIACLCTFYKTLSRSFKSELHDGIRVNKEKGEILPQLSESLSKFISLFGLGSQDKEIKACKQKDTQTQNKIRFENKQFMSKY